MNKKILEEQLVAEISGKNLMEHAEYITSEDRESGSPGEKRAAEYFRQFMQQQGLDVTIRYVENYISLPVSGKLALEGGKALESCITHSYGSSTGEAGLRGEAVLAAEGDVKGKIAVMHGLASAVPCKKLENAGAVGIICITQGKCPYNMSISPIWGQPVPDTVDLISKIPVVTVNAADGQVLLDHLAAGKSEVWMQTEVSTKFRTVPICVAELKAAHPTEKFMMFGGHLDSWHKGGIDNGGSNATIMELARVFQHYREYLHVNIRFVMWSGHSNGRYSGSNWYADYHWEDLYENCVANFDIDSIGAKGATSFRHIECNKQCFGVGHDVVAERTGQDAAYMRIQRNGDQSFWAMGIPTLFEILSLQPESQQGQGTFMPGLPWYWHTICDTFEHLGEEELLRDSQIIAAAIWRFASSNAYPFRFKDVILEMQGDIRGYQKASQGTFDFNGILQLLTRLEEQTEALDIQIRQLNDKDELSDQEQERRDFINRVSFALNQILIPVHYCRKGDLFQVDLALPVPPFPEFEKIPELAALDPASDAFKFLERQLVRERNRVFHYLKKASVLLETI